MTTKNIQNYPLGIINIHQKFNGKRNCLKCLSVLQTTALLGHLRLELCICKRIRVNVSMGLFKGGCYG